MSDDAQIPLYRKGEVVGHATVDADLAEWLSGWRWTLHTDGYAMRGLSHKRRVYMHRVILGLRLRDGKQADHVSGDRLDNRRSNLRVVTNAQNGQNRRGGYGTSRYRGVSWNAWAGKWRAQAQLNGRNHFIGYFEDEDEAARAADDWRAAHMPFFVRRVPVGAEPPELVGFTTTDDVEAVCESCGDPCDGDCGRHETEER